MKILGQLIYIEPNKQEGFNFGYFIKILNRGTDNKIQLIGECNNCGIVDEAEVAYKKTLWEIEYNGLVCKKLQARLECSAIVLPCFIRPMDKDREQNVYTHMLTSQAIKTEMESIKRVDKQFANMINNARKVLTTMGFDVSEKVIMTGFSASSKFAQRFALLYPEMVSCVVAGGMSALPSFPIKELNGEVLNYPLGINDYKQLMGRNFKLNQYMKINQYLFMGDQDNIDPVKYDDCVTREERRIIHTILDEDMQKRWTKMVEIIDKLNLTNLHTFLIEGVKHTPQGMDPIINEHLNEIISNTSNNTKLQNQI